MNSFNKHIGGSGYPGGKRFEDIDYAFAPSRPQLQAADLYVYLWNRHLNGLAMGERELAGSALRVSFGWTSEAGDGARFVREFTALAGRVAPAAKAAA